MPVQIREETGGKVIVVELSGRLAREDYEHFIPEVEQAIGKFGKVRMLVQMRDFHGWSAGALWEDIKFDWKHFSHIERLAIVGESQWEKGMATFCKPFTSAEVRYFDVAKLDEALKWIHQGIASVQPAGAGH